MQLVTRRQDDGRQEHVKEDLIVEIDEVSDRIARRDEDDEANGHA